MVSKFRNDKVQSTLNGLSYVFYLVSKLSTSSVIQAKKTLDINLSQFVAYIYQLLDNLFWCLLHFMHLYWIYLRPPDAQFYTLLGAGESIGGGPTRGTGNSNTAQDREIFYVQIQSKVETEKSNVRRQNSPEQTKWHIKFLKINLLAVIPSECRPPGFYPSTLGEGKEENGGNRKQYCAIPEIGTMITLPSQVSRYSMLPRCRKCIWNVSQKSP